MVRRDRNIQLTLTFFKNEVVVRKVRLRSVSLCQEVRDRRDNLRAPGPRQTSGLTDRDEGVAPADCLGLGFNDPLPQTLHLRDHSLRVHDAPGAAGEEPRTESAHPINGRGHAGRLLAPVVAVGHGVGAVILGGIPRTLRLLNRAVRSREALPQPRTLRLRGVGAGAMAVERVEEVSSEVGGGGVHRSTVEAPPLARRGRPAPLGIVASDGGVPLCEQRPHPLRGDAAHEAPPVAARAASVAARASATARSAAA